MLTIYRRHVGTCAHRSEGRKYRRCRCPIWVDGFLGHKEIRESLKTRDWEKAQGIIREWEAEGEQSAEAEPVTVAEAWQQYLVDAEARKLRRPTVYKYKLLSRQMEAFALANRLRFLREFDLPMLRRFRASWPNENLGALKKLENLRAFFRFAHGCKWVDENPARMLQSPQVTQRPTIPFTPEQMTDILAACERYGRKCRGGKYRANENVRRIWAFVLLLRHSGLRIGDAVTLERSGSPPTSVLVHCQDWNASLRSAARVRLEPARGHPEDQ
jgi:hypothetical protein